MTDREPDYGDRIYIAPKHSTWPIFAGLGAGAALILAAIFLYITA